MEFIRLHGIFFKESEISIMEVRGKWQETKKKIGNTIGSRAKSRSEGSLSAAPVFTSPYICDFPICWQAKVGFLIASLAAGVAAISTTAIGWACPDWQGCWDVATVGPAHMNFPQNALED